MKGKKKDRQDRQKRLMWWHLSSFPPSSELSQEQRDQIKCIRLFRNRMNFIEEADFQRLANLEVLDLHQNNISDIKPGTFRSLRSLRYLNLQYNKWDNVSDVAQWTQLFFFLIVSCHTFHSGWWTSQTQPSKDFNIWRAWISAIIRSNTSPPMPSSIPAGWEKSGSTITR